MRPCFVECAHRIQVQGFAAAAGLLRPIQYSNGLSAARKCFAEKAHVEWTVQVYFENANALTPCVQVIYRFMDSLAARSHNDDDTFRVRRAIVFIKAVLASG